MLLLFRPRASTATVVTGMYDEPTPAQVTAYDSPTPSGTHYDSPTPS